MWAFLTISSPLLRRGGDGHADDAAVGARVQAEVAVPDRLLAPTGQSCGFPGLDQDQGRVGRREVRDLVQGRRRPVVLHVDPLEQADGRAARPKVLQLGLERVDGDHHPALGLLPDLGEGIGSLLSLRPSLTFSDRLQLAGSPASTVLPIGSPSDDALDVPGDEEVEDPDRDPALAAERDGRGVHHGEPPLEDLLVGDVGQEDGGGSPSSGRRCRCRRPSSP